MAASNRKTALRGKRLGKIIGKGLQHFEKNFELRYLKEYVFLPELVMHFGAYRVKGNFVRQTATANEIDDCICFSFYNVFEDKVSKRSTRPSDPPHVRVFPISLSQQITFRKGTQVTHISIGISAAYLKSFLKEDSARFGFLFGSSNNFLVEEIMTDEMLNTVNDIVKKEEPRALKSYHYKLKAMELLLALFRSLRKREKSVHRKLNEREINAVYKVRDRIVASLSAPPATDELKQIAGMNELKLRRIFTQVFGRGIYEYCQHLRMKEAARLLREEKLSVSETGYRMGFENLSHFSRVFEKHLGKKPKKYSRKLS